MEHVQTIRGVTVVELASHYDSLDEDAIRRLEGLLRDLADTVDPPVVLLDMRQTTSIGSTFVGALFAAEKRLRRRSGQLALCHLGEFCTEVLRVVRSDTLFRIFATRDEGVVALVSTPSPG